MTAKRKPAPKKSVWQPAFLAALANCGVVRAACTAANITSGYVYQVRLKDPKFAAAWEQALEDAADSLEAEAVKRARAGSDTLLIFLLKAARPEKYRERYHTEHSGPGGGPIKHEHQDYSKLTDEELSKAAAELAEKSRDIAAAASGLGAGGKATGGAKD